MKVRDVILKAISDRAGDNLAQAMVNELGKNIINERLSSILHYGGGDSFPYYYQLVDFVNENRQEIYDYLADYTCESMSQGVDEFLISLGCMKELVPSDRQDLYRFLGGNNIKGDPSGWLIGVLMFEEIAHSLDELLSELEDLDDDDEVNIDDLDYYN